MVKVAEGLVAKPLDEGADKAQCKENKDKGFPIPVPHHPGMLTNGFNGMKGVNREDKAVNGRNERNRINGGYYS